MSCTNNIITSDNINESILVGPHESSTRIDRDSSFEVCAINFTCGITTPRIDGDVILGISTTLEQLEVTELFCAPLGEPKHDGVDFCVSGELKLDHFSDDIGLDLTPETQIVDAFQLVDNWLKTYLVSQPPAVCVEERISCDVPETASPDYFYLEWKLPPRRCLGILDVEVPVINNVIIDYVKSSLNPDCDFTHPDTISITADPTTERFQAYVDNSGGEVSGMLGTTIWGEYIVEPGVEYDVRVYGKNYNCDHELNYIVEKELCTLLVGIPSITLNLTCGSETIETIGLNWNKPLDHNDLFPGNNITPNLEQYRINFEAKSTVRFGGLITHQGNLETGNTNTSRTMTALNPGTTYEFSVEAKNVLNDTGGDDSDGYGPNSNTIQCTTLVPNPPNELNTISLANTGTLTYSGGGCKLDDSKFYQYIYNYNRLDPDNIDENKQIRTTEVTNIRNNFVAGTTALMTSTINGYSGLTATYLSNKATTDIDGFGNTVAPGGFFDGSSITNLQINKDEEFYASPTDFQGFWKDWDGYVVAYDLGVTSEDTTSVFYANWDREYKLLLEQVHNDDSPPHTNTPSELTFVIDDLNVLPSVTSCGIIANPGNDIDYVTGIPTFTDSACFDYQFVMEDIARKFIRVDKCHAIVGLYLSDNTVVSQIDTIDFDDIGTEHKYYTAPGVTTGQQYYETSTTLHNTNGLILKEDPGDIQFNDFEICLDPTLAEEVCDEDLRIRITPCNLYGIGTPDNCPYLGITTGETKSIRIDTCSLVCLEDLTDDYGNFGRLVSSGTGQYPDLGTTDGTTFIETDQSVYVGITYDHTLNVFDELPEQLVLFEAKWQNPPLTNYNDYFFPDGTIVPDLSGIVEDGSYRYVTFAYRRTAAQFDPNSTGRIFQSKVRLTINDPTGLYVDYSIPGSANHRLYLKVDGYGQGGLPTYNGQPNDGDPSNWDTYWLDCTDAVASIGIINGIQSQNLYTNYPSPPVVAGDGVTCLETTTSETQSTTVNSGEIRNCFIPVVTTADAIFYVRIGWPNDVDYNFACGIQLDIIEGDFDAPENVP
jgi:hypothetical protein